jgi:glycosyltransferase involved in cell wall biosynthesis
VTPPADTDRPRIAVIVPCFNDGATLPEALASLEQQEPVELVVVNDGSTDPDTLTTLTGLTAAGVRVVHQENRGLPAARMAGVEVTHAPLIYPLDADDAIEPGALARLADALERDPGAALAWGDQQLFGDLDLVCRRARALDPWAITHVNMLPVSVLIRRAELLAAGGWELRGGYEDWDLWMDLAERGRRGVYVAGPCQRYRVGSGRMLAETVSRHPEQFARLRARHPSLFAARRINWRRSTAPIGMRLLVPVAARLPASELTRHRVARFVSQPLHGVRTTLSRRAARRR